MRIVLILLIVFRNLSKNLSDQISPSKRHKYFDQRGEIQEIQEIQERLTFILATICNILSEGWLYQFFYDGYGCLHARRYDGQIV